MGSGEGTAFNGIWQELGAVQVRPFINHDIMMQFEGSDDRVFSIYTDIDRLERHMQELAPADSSVIEDFCNGARRLTRFDDALGDLSEPAGWLDGLKTAGRMLPLMGTLLKYGKISAAEFAARFTDPLLQRAFLSLFDSRGPDCPVLGLMIMLAGMHNGDLGYPVGGSLEFARAIERRYLDLGGEIHYRSRVKEILVEADPAGRADRAVGIRLTDGTEHRADVVISAADGRATIIDMLDGRYASDQVRADYEGRPIHQSWIQVSLGVACDLSDEVHSVRYALDEPIDIAGEEVESIWFRHFCQDPSMAPSGKSAVVAIFMSDHTYWKELYQEPERYEAEKKDIAIKVIDQLEHRLPSISGKVEVVDVSTPMTVERYTGNWQGSMMGWTLTASGNPLAVLNGMDKALPGLEGFYMAGQWVEPGGGTSPAARSARSVIGMICKKDRKKFKSSRPAMS
jgi:phytoene dehydrogenase-like protein